MFIALIFSDNAPSRNGGDLAMAAAIDHVFIIGRGGGAVYHNFTANRAVRNITRRNSSLTDTNSAGLSLLLTCTRATHPAFGIYPLAWLWSLIGMKPGGPMIDASIHKTARFECARENRENFYGRDSTVLPPRHSYATVAPRYSLFTEKLHIREYNPAGRDISQVLSLLSARDVAYTRA